MVKALSGAKPFALPLKKEPSLNQNIPWLSLGIFHSGANPQHVHNITIIQQA